MKNTETHRQNNEKTMKNNGSTHDQLKMSQYAEKMQYRHPPIQEHLVYSHLICMYMIVNVHTYSAYMCVQGRFRRLPSCLFNISLSWGIPWENPRRAF